VAADPVPHVRMTPWREGIHVDIVAVPVPGGRRAVEPGSGAAVVVETVGGALRQARRDLAGEAAQARALLSHCPSLADGRWAWDLETVLAAVAFLGELSDYEGPRVIEWPQGEAFSLTRKVGAGDFTATVASGIDWFAVDGRLRVDDVTVLSLMDLLARMRDAPGGYIALDDRRFLRLDAHFRRQLQALAAIGRRRQDGIEAPALAVPALRELLDGAEVAGDAPWQEAVRRFEAAAGHCPRVPATLTAELRPYQEEGFRWLSRLAAWGAGACLADDMGLGKTVQALAVILERCAGGPTLVVAPTSVCFNWKDEMRRFAPTLAPHVVHDLENREAEILALGPFDVLLCSYTLLHQHGETLS